MEIENGGDFKIGDTYSISMNRKIGSGAFGEIFRGKSFNLSHIIRSEYKNKRRSRNKNGNI